MRAALLAKRTVFDAEHEAFRLKIRQFLQREAVPHLAHWEKTGYPDRAFWLKAGDAGLLRASIPREYGGWGGDVRYGAVAREEMAQVGIGGTGLGVMFSADVAALFLIRFGTHDQKLSWLPKIAAGEAIAALAMTEPDAGSDVQGFSSTAERQVNDWCITGTKAYITNGHQADLIIVAAKTTPKVGAHGLSLFLVPGDSAGLTKGPPLRKLGLRYEDAAELHFDNVRVPTSHLLGEENKGFGYLMEGMVWERMQIACMAVAVADMALEKTIAFVKKRQAFGKRLIDFQNTRFILAECATETALARLFVDRCLEQYCMEGLSDDLAAMAKYWCTDLQARVVDRCLQLHGGAGYLLDNPLGRAYADARVTRIYGGTNEIMKEIIARTL